MKNTKITKIALLVLSVALLVGAAIGFSVSAEETAKEYEILAKNVVYGDKTAVAVAVNATIEEANNETVKVAYYWAEDGAASWEKATLLNTNVANNLYEGKPTFAAAGVAAKNLGDVLYLTTYTGDAPADDANWISYSPAEYFYSRLYKDVFINKTEADGIDYNKKLMYEAQLQLSANAQVVLNHNTDNLVSDCTMAYTGESSGITINGGRYAFAVDGSVTTINLVYTGSEAYTGFKVNNSVVRKSANGATAVKVSGINEISLYTDEIPVYGLDFESSVTTGVHLATGTAVLQESIVKGETYTPASTKGVWGNIVEVTKKYEDGREEVSNVLKVMANNGASQSTSVDTTGPIYIAPTKSSDDGGNIHVLEFDFNYAQTTKAGYRNPLNIHVYDSTGTKLGAVVDSTGQDKYKVFITNNSTFTEGTVVENAYQLGICGPGGSLTAAQPEDPNGSFNLLNSDTWYRIRYVWDQSTGKVNIAASNDGGETWYKVCSQQTRSAFENADYITFSWDTLWNCGSITYFDNISYNVVSEMPEMPSNNGITE